MNPPKNRYELSVVILNYNGARWLHRCFESLRAQTLFPRFEVVVADNLSQDGSGALAQSLLQDWPNGVYVDNGANLGFCEGNNRAAQAASGRFLLFLNNDTWLEPDCLERLMAEIARTGAQGGAPLVMNYDDNSIQTFGASGYDLFGFHSLAGPHEATRPAFAWSGCAYLIEAELFHRIGGFDAEFFLYHDENDLCWRLWIAGARGVVVPQSRLHHRSEANVNPAGGGQILEMRTSDSKRFYATRNGLLVVLKNAQHLLLLLVPLQLALLALEAVVSMCLVRRWSYFRRVYVEALRDCWRLRHHVLRERRRIAGFRQRGDFWMLRFLRLRPNRWYEVERMFRLGLPKVTPSEYKQKKP